MKVFAISLVLAVSVAGPAMADPGKSTPPVLAEPTSVAPAPDSANVIDEAAIADATTPEARRALLIRCSGPPPRPAKVARVEAGPEATKDVSLEPNLK